jgi:flavin reductase (DIM6/NTAB) family NADH-FMN oxidoreductase RutF
MTVPAFPEGVAAVLSTTDEDGRPHAIPVSTVVRSGATTVLLALGGRRASLANLRRDPRAALTLLAEGLAVTLHGRASEAGEAAGPVAVRLEVEHVQDHDQPTFSIDAPVAWHWTDAEAAERDEAVRAALRGLG